MQKTLFQQPPEPSLTIPQSASRAAIHPRLSYIQRNRWRKWRSEQAAAELRSVLRRIPIGGADAVIHRRRSGRRYASSTRVKLEAIKRTVYLGVYTQAKGHLKKRWGLPEHEQLLIWT